MNFYKHHIGDYQKKTATLSLAEHGAYLLMLQHYYATEQPLPTGRELYKLLRAESKQERSAIDTIIEKFWTLTERGLVNGRAIEEIARASHQRAVNQQIGRRGGRPRTQSETESVSKNRTESETESVSREEPNREPNRNPSQTPDSRLQTKTKDDPLRGLSSPSGADPPVLAANGSVPPCPHEQIVALYAEKCSQLPQVAVINEHRRRHLQARWREVCAAEHFSRDEGLVWFGDFFSSVSRSKFLTGRAPASDKNRAPFIADFDWLLSPRNFARVVEGRYEDRR